jgi:hypothetical protein
VRVDEWKMVNAGTVVYTWQVEFNGDYTLSSNISTEIQRVLISAYIPGAAVSALWPLTAVKQDPLISLLSLSYLTIA